MASDQHATADVNMYEGAPGGMARATATVQCRDGTTVPLSVPFSATQVGETASMKYANEFRKILDALRSKRVLPYGERGWKVPYESGEALIGDEISAGYSGVYDKDRIDLDAFMEALAEVCSDPARVKVPPFFEAERPQSLG